MLKRLLFVAVGFLIAPQMEPDARVLGSKVKREDWTFEQDMVFEHAMAEFDETVSGHVLASSSNDGTSYSCRPVFPVAFRPLSALIFTTSKSDFHTNSKSFVPENVGAVVKGLTC